MTNPNYQAQEQRALAAMDRMMFRIRSREWFRGNIVDEFMPGSYRVIPRAECIRLTACDISWAGNPGIWRPCRSKNCDSAVAGATSAHRPPVLKARPWSG